VVIGLLATLVIFYTSSSFRAPSPEEQAALDLPPGAQAPSKGDPVTRPSHNGESIYQVQNETLGFQEIYMISLPGRSDKQDAFAMQAAFSEISYTQVDGVYGVDVPKKALPHVGAV
jgi:hypothetical protein